MPAWQVSPAVQALPSSHGVPSGAAGSEQTPVAGSQIPATWHWSDATQRTALPVHTPTWQVSVCVHALPSSHAVPSATSGSEQAPVVGSHVPAAWHWSDATQSTGLDPVHTPASQVSVRVHALPSLHAVPFGTSGFEQTPLAGSQVPTTWHWSEATQITGFAPVHTPASHVSVRVHAFPSLHEVPFGASGFEQVPVAGSHVPAT